MNSDANIKDKDVRMEKDPFAKTSLVYEGRYGGSSVAVKEFYGSFPV